MASGWREGLGRLDGLPHVSEQHSLKVPAPLRLIVSKKVPNG